MTNTPQSSTSPTQTKNKRTLLLIVLLLASCTFSSVVGIIIGQIGNQIYKVLGQYAACLSIPGFIGLFLVTFGLSFFSNKLFKKWLMRSTK